MALMYSAANDVVVTRNQLAQIMTPPPMGRFHAPYPFAEYVGDVYNGLQQNGIEVVGEEFAVTKDHMSFFGLMSIMVPGHEELDGYELTVGLRGSHNQRIPRGMVLGTQVLVCSNLCFHGDIAQFRTKQTLNMVDRLPELIRSSVQRIPMMADVQKQNFDSLKLHQMRPEVGDQVLVEIYRRGGFSSPQLTRAIDEWHKPSHEEHAEDGWSAWRLFNAGTEALKPTGQSTNMHLVEARSNVVEEVILAQAA